MSKEKYKSDWGDYFRKACDETNAIMDAARAKEKDPERERNLAEYGTANPDMIYSIKCHRACEGFPDPLELRRQRDFAVRALHNLMAHQIRPDNPPEPWKSAYEFLDSIEIDQGANNDTRSH